MKVEELKIYKDHLYNGLSRDLSDFEKNFILISSGILTFTITFLRDLLTHGGSNCKAFLILAWILIILSIGVMMFTFLYSAKASDKLSKIVDDFMLNHSLFDAEIVLNEMQTREIKEKTNKSFSASKQTLFNLRIFAIVFFMVGILLLTFFVFLNY